MSVESQDRLAAARFQPFHWRVALLAGWLVGNSVALCWCHRAATVQAAPGDWHSASFELTLLSVGDRETRGRPEAEMTSPSAFSGFWLCFRGPRGTPEMEIGTYKRGS